MVLTNVKYTAIINPCFISDVFTADENKANGNERDKAHLGNPCREPAGGASRQEERGDITRELSR